MKNIIAIIKLAKPLYKLIILVGILIVIVSLFQLATPLLSKFIVDEIVAQINGTGGNLQRLIWLIGAAFGTSVLGVLVTALSERLGDHLTGEIRRFLTERYYHKVLTLPQSFYDSQISGKVVNQLNRGIQTIHDFINTLTNFILPNILQIILSLAVMFYYSVPVGFFILILFPIYVTLSNYSTKIWGKEEAKKNVLEDKVRGRISEVIGNIKLVKSFITELQEYRFVSENLKKINRIFAKQSRDFHIFDMYRNLSLQVILAIVNIVIFYSTFQGTLTIGELVLLLQLIGMTRAPLFAMSYILEQVQRAEQGSKEYFEVMDLPSVELYDSEETVERVKQAKIEFRNVSFKYEESDMVIKDMSFTLNPNEQVALVGHSGVGKSTIVSLILKFYDVTNGQIHFNDTPYAELTHKFIRNNVSLVFQENELFSSTIFDNVAYGMKATEEDVMRALKLANAFSFVEKLPNGIHSEIGERGVRLSGGQKQRIQIARAILKDAPILILDEATSSLDARSEKEVQVGLEKLVHNRLTLIIAHRFSTIQDVHKIIVLDKGGVVDCGTPQELARKPGIYSDLLRYQVEGNKKLLEQYELY
jgi:ATP-binding cassette subfamily B protein